MNCQEFRDNFDLLYNNLSSNAAPGLDSFEISLLLTKAQDELVKNKILSLGNKYQAGAEESSKRQIDLSTLVETRNYQVAIPPIEIRSNKLKLPSNYIAETKKDAIYILQRFLGPYNKLGWVNVIPMSHKEFSRMRSRPFGEPMKRQAWEILESEPFIFLNTGDLKKIPAQDYGADTIPYSVTLIRKPTPIILEDLTGTDTIEGYNTKKECELPNEVHQEILQRAVEIAKAEYMTSSEDLNNQTTIGQRSE